MEGVDSTNGDYNGVFVCLGTVKLSPHFVNGIGEFTDSSVRKHKRSAPVWVDCFGSAPCTRCSEAETSITALGG